MKYIFCLFPLMQYSLLWPKVSRWQQRQPSLIPLSQPQQWQPHILVRQAPLACMYTAVGLYGYADNIKAKYRLLNFINPTWICIDSMFSRYIEVTLISVIFFYINKWYLFNFHTIRFYHGHVHWCSIIHRWSH